MTIHAREIRSTLDKYTAEYPAEHDGLVRLRTLLGEDAPVTSRHEFRGHVTCGVVLVDPSWRVLHIHHNALDRWLLPGGHLEPEDQSLTEAALRELAEETGIGASYVRPLGGYESVPVDIDAHAIPDSPSKGEPAHLHFDFRHVFRADRALPVTLQLEEVAAYRWLPISDLASSQLKAKLVHLAER